MLNNALRLDHREKGQFPISIGTSLAFEGLFGIYPERPEQKSKINEYQEIWINVRTLFRNMQGSIKKEEEYHLTASDYAMGIREEMVIIQGILDDRTRGRVKAFFYACAYKNLKAYFKEAVIKEDNTEKQKHYTAMENRTLEALMEELKYSGPTFIPCDVTIKGNNNIALFITHYPVDLLSANNFSDIALLETHSGVIKKKPEWNTKLLNGKTLTRIPFNKMSIQLFGDSGHMFSPWPKEYRDAVLDVAARNNWNPMTTKDRILLTVDQTKMPTLISAVRRMF